MNTAIVSPTGGSVGIGFAIPSEIVSHIVADLRDQGRIERGWLGVSVRGRRRIRRRRRASTGWSAAARRCARRRCSAGDVVLAVNGDHVDTARSLIRAVAAVAARATSRT